MQYTSSHNANKKKKKWIILTSPTSILLVYLIYLLVPNLTHQRTAKDNLTESVVESGALIVMAYPDLIVRITESSYHSALTYIGIGDGERTRAGHACMVLIKNNSSTFEYFDNGRYIAPEGFSRVGGADTDIETLVEVEAKWEDGKIANLEELLQWLYDHPEKTHGEGDLYASVNYNVSYDRVKEYIDELQKIDIIPYGPFEKEGSNCSRFVTDAMSVGILDDKTQEKIEDLYRITPAVLGNVEAASSDGIYYRVTSDSLYITNEDLIDTQRKLLFDWGENYPDYCPIGSLVEPQGVKDSEEWQWLSGIGYGVWYNIKPTEVANRFTVSQYNNKGKEVFTDTFVSEEPVALQGDFSVTYPSHYRHITIINDVDTIRLTRLI